MSKSETPSPVGPETTRQRLLAAACQLFSTHGVDGVTVRDIMAAAGARNGASLHYYFGTKEALIRELVVEGARLINMERSRLLDEAEALDSVLGLRSVVRILVVSSFPSPSNGETLREGYLRFIMVLQLTHRELFIEALQNQWNSGYMRCVDHFRRILAARMPAPLVEQRLRLMALYLGAALSSREASMQGQTRTRLWGFSFDLDNLVDTVCGILERVPAPETLAPLNVPANEAVASRRTP